MPRRLSYPYALQLLFVLVVVVLVALVVLVLLLTLLTVVLFHFLSPPKDLSLLLPQKPEISLQQKQQKGLSAWKACAKMEN